MAPHSLNIVALVISLAAPTSGVLQEPLAPPQQSISIQKPIEPPKISPVSKLAPIPVPPPKPTTPSVSTSCGDNADANYIYMHESGCNPNATNPQGCYGIGQDCNGIVRAKCGPDYACQNDYFTTYANSRYGGWAGAHSAWVTKGWW